MTSAPKIRNHCDMPFPVPVMPIVPPEPAASDANMTTSSRRADVPSRQGFVRGPAHGCARARRGPVRTTAVDPTAAPAVGGARGCRPRARPRRAGDGRGDRCRRGAPAADEAAVGGTPGRRPRAVLRGLAVLEQGVAVVLEGPQQGGAHLGAGGGGRQGVVHGPSRRQSGYYGLMTASPDKTA